MLVNLNTLFIIMSCGINELVPLQSSTALKMCTFNYMFAILEKYISSLGDNRWERVLCSFHLHV